MSKKTILTPEQIQECINLYKNELLGSPAISEKMGIHKTIIIRTLKENGIEFGQSGRRNIGGKAVADKKYASKNKEKLNEYHKTWSKEKRKELREYHSKWRDENREHVNEKTRLWYLNRRRTDPSFRLKSNTRTAVWTCLKERNVAKYRSTFALLGYTIEELMKHLESLFTSGMTWNNYGEWHVDHKRPMTSFEFTSTDDEGFKECWALSNLQPLWEVDNLSKGTRYL
jgi:hypothetical protein